MLYFLITINKERYANTFYLFVKFKLKKIYIKY